MLISHKYRVIFIHIQRTGGNSIRNLFTQADPELIQTLPLDKSKNRFKHCFISDLPSVIEPEIFSSYTKFSIVRNPYERLFSWYLMFKYQVVDTGIKKGKIAHAVATGEAVMKEVEPYLKSFECFLSMPNEGLLERFYYNQLDYLQINQNLAVDKILRFENLSNDFNILAKQLNLTATLPHVNQVACEQDYRENYTKKAKQIVSQRFQRDLDYFSYTF